MSAESSFELEMRESAMCSIDVYDDYFVWILSLFFADEKCVKVGEKPLSWLSLF